MWSIVVPDPTAPNVNPLISLSVAYSTPGNSIRTYRKVPELS